MAGQFRVFKKGQAQNKKGANINLPRRIASLLEGTRNKVVNESMHSTPACQKESKNKTKHLLKNHASQEVIYKRIFYKKIEGKRTKHSSRTLTREQTLLLQKPWIQQKKTFKSVVGD